MNKKLKFIGMFLSVVILLSANVSFVTAAAEYSSVTRVGESHSVVINGKSLKGVTTFEENGILNVKLSPIVKDVGESIKWDADTQTATVMQKDKTIVKVTANKTVAKVNNKDIPLSTKKINNVIVPVSAKAIVIDGSLYVPEVALKNVFGYSVQIKGLEKSDLKKAANPDPHYPFPEGWTPPKITNSTWSSDKQKNMKALENELEFKNLGAGADFSPYGGVGTTAIGVSANKNDEYDTMITIYYWSGDVKETPLANKVPYIAKELLHFYFPKDGDKIWKIADDGFNGVKGIGQYFDKMLTYETRQVKFMAVKESLVIIIGKPGVKYDSDWKVIK